MIEGRGWVSDILKEWPWELVTPGFKEGKFRDEQYINKGPICVYFICSISHTKVPLRCRLTANGCQNVTEDALFTFSSRLLSTQSWWCQRWARGKISPRYQGDGKQISEEVQPQYDGRLLLVRAKRDRCPFQVHKQWRAGGVARRGKDGN